jgi:hypothetical protein
MSRARLVITAVTVEKRPVSEVARSYGVARSWIYTLLARYRAEGDRPERCFDCGVARGGAHHRNCAWEACPVCSGQLITCPCGTTLTDELAAE